MITTAQLATWTEQQDMGSTKAMDLTKELLAKVIESGNSMETVIQYAQQIAKYEGHLQVCHRIDMMILANCTTEKIVATVTDMSLSDYADPRDVAAQARAEGKRMMVRKVLEFVNQD